MWAIAQYDSKGINMSDRELYDYLKDNLSISIDSNTEGDYRDGRFTTTITVRLHLYNPYTKKVEVISESGC